MTAHPSYDALAPTAAGSSPLADAVLVAAAMSTGIVTGVLFVYANAVMPGLRRTDDRTFVGAFQSIDRAIVNPLFLTLFFGALVLIAASVALHLGAGSRAALPWLVAALALYLAVVVITLAVNVPLNDGIKAAGDPDRIGDLAEVRRAFDEARWAAWNLVRTLASTAAFGLLVTAALLYGHRK
ncbi:membrane protein [Actinomadura rubrobrunea]|uniref:Membrane protein n=1 Tax=Actinomadura rubrobrunea TaxID=115335 RepID=A0A9W6UXX4_9ACTN|nr:anthrone oxygenase family protein [Actinomadura rubrobrunea]GLW65687.1 membrane protein [Actinomadura rubrobrunea]